MSICYYLYKNRLDDEDNLYDEFIDEQNLNLGLEDEYFSAFKNKIKSHKENKGHGLLISFHKDNEEKRIEKLIKAMKLGLRVVLVSDAGTPTISDPGTKLFLIGFFKFNNLGYKLVKEAVKNGISIEPLPGPVAGITALTASGMPTDKFVFYGFLTKIAGPKREKLEEIKKQATTAVIYEGIHRLESTVELIGSIFGINHELYIGIELTKKFEKHLHGKVSTILEKLNEFHKGGKEVLKGEATIVIGIINS